MGVSTVNRVILIGNIDDEPQIHILQNGSKVANFIIKTVERWKDGKTGEEKTRTERHKIAVFSDRFVDVIRVQAKCGSVIYVEGQIETRTWVDPQGVPRSSVDIVIRPQRGSVQLMVIENEKEREDVTAF